MSTPQIKVYLQKSLHQLGLYERAKASWIYDAYWNLADKRVVDDRHSELGFYRELLSGLQKGDIIFDVGANHGYKTQIFLELGAKVVAIEPDRSSQDVLAKKFLRGRLKKKPLVVVGKAVSDTNSQITMWVDSPGSAMNTLSEKWAATLKTNDQRLGHKLSFENRVVVETISVDALIKEHGQPFFVKIDVEGHELSVLRGMLQSVPYLSFEVNLPEFRREALESIQVLARLNPEGKFNFTSDCRRGFAMDQWHVVEEFSAILESCDESSIEVFWKTPIHRQ